jgi:hypothetical protein
MAKNGKALPSDFTGVDHKQAEYWFGGISREEIQPTFDEYGMNITAIKKSLWGVTKGEAGSPRHYSHRDADGFGARLHLQQIRDQAIFSARLDIFYPQTFSRFLKSRVFQQPLDLSTVTPGCPLKECRGVKFERGPRSVAVIYLKGVLSGVAAIFVALLGPGLLQALKSISRQQANGLGAIAGFWNPLFSPLFWILAISSFVLFLTASRLGSKVLRIVLFWIPTLFVSALGFGLVALFTYGWMHFRKA